MIITQADRTSAARVLAGNLNIEERVYVRSIEEFIAGNVEEMAVYSKTKKRSVLKRLLEAYNKRVGEVESDPSMQVEIPDNLP